MQNEFFDFVMFGIEEQILKINTCDTGQTLFKTLTIPNVK